MPENPELYGMGGIAGLLIAAWARFRPAMRKIEADEDSSLRNDLFKRITELENARNAQDQRHEENVKAIRSDYEARLARERASYERMRENYEQRIQILMDTLFKEPPK